VSSIPESILNSTKKVLGLEEDYTAFDVDVVMHINSVLSILGQLGIGPEEGFAIEDADETWTDLFSDVKLLNMVKTYVYLRVRMLFDPPTTSFAISAMERQIDELTSRISIHREFEAYPVVVTP
jgi:hypothetical protein